jgi:hypothetical protein
VSFVKKGNYKNSHKVIRERRRSNGNLPYSEIHTALRFEITKSLNPYLNL